MAASNTNADTRAQELRNRSVFWLRTAIILLLFGLLSTPVSCAKVDGPHSMFMPMDQLESDSAKSHIATEHADDVQPVFWGSAPSPMNETEPSQPAGMPGEDGSGEAASGLPETGDLAVSVLIAAQTLGVELVLSSRGEPLFAQDTWSDGHAEQTGAPPPR